MPMITTNDLKIGMTIVFRDRLWDIIDFQHVKPGKGGAFVRTKLKDTLEGRVLENTFRAGEKVEQAIIEKQAMEYIYRDGSSYYFMHPETYEQIPINEELLGDGKDFLKENTVCSMKTHNDEVIALSIPETVTLSVVKADPAARGNTATNVTKPVTLETGAVIQVPAFIEEGDVLKVDTRKGEYLERVKS